MANHQRNKSHKLIQNSTSKRPMVGNTNIVVVVMEDNVAIVEWSMEKANNSRRSQYKLSLNPSV